MINKRKRTLPIIVAFTVIIVVAGLVVISCTTKQEDKEGEPKGKEGELLLSDYPKLFERDVLIVVGKNVSEVESEIAKAIQSTFERLTGSKAMIKGAEALSGDDKAKSNMIVIDIAGANGLFQEIHTSADKHKITKDYPGKNKGILKILKNTWNKDRALLIVSGSDEWGLKVSELVLRQQKLEKKPKIIIDWEEYTKVKFPIDSEEEAIRYAKTDPDVGDFIEGWSSRDFRENTWAAWSPKGNFWEVGISPISHQPNIVTELLFLIQFRRDGTIIKKGIVQGS